ncbi:hypothetical protein BHM03_00008162 [Ensete ventricosum]|nr:hypothetical protein BHM03_00008162 [Ensete ventricosum]
MKHVTAFYAQMTLYGTSDAIMCWAFLTILRGIARGWYSWLSPSSIHSFNQLAREFEGNFLSSARPKPTVASLLGMRQKEEEHLGQYLAHFTDGVRAIPDAHPSLIIQAFMIGIRPSHLFWSLVERPPTTVQEILQRADQYITVETLVAEKREDHKHPRGVVSSSTRKAYASAEVQKRPRPRCNPRFTFESENEYLDHDNALVVTARIANAYVRRIMIDTGSSANILYLDVFHKLGMTNRDLTPMTSTLTGFTGDAITPVEGGRRIGGGG